MYLIRVPLANNSPFRRLRFNTYVLIYYYNYIYVANIKIYKVYNCERRINFSL